MAKASSFVSSTEIDSVRSIELSFSFLFSLLIIFFASGGEIEKDSLPGVGNFVWRGSSSFS
jgi:hypothetical protein